MTQFFNDQGCRVLVNHLVDGGHYPHLHQFLDQLGRFHGHALGKFVNRDRFRYHDIMNNGRNRLFKAMFCFGNNTEVAPDLSFLALAALFSGNMQFFATKQRFIGVRLVLAMLGTLTTGFIGSRFSEFDFFS